MRNGLNGRKQTNSVPTICKGIFLPSAFAKGQQGEAKQLNCPLKDGRKTIFIMKKLFLFALVGAIGTVVVVNSCKKKEESDTDKVKAIAKEYCDCRGAADKDAAKLAACETGLAALAPMLAKYESDPFKVIELSLAMMEECPAIAPSLGMQEDK
ncbi:hypothetical protein AGMMS4956_21620 [Bacteroidia bacterium]|nr:hypothetical protein AGMMS4956_21620 [Bacteroidia bacterium]